MFPQTICERVSSDTLILPECFVVDITLRFGIAFNNSQFNPFGTSLSWGSVKVYLQSIISKHLRYMALIGWSHFSSVTRIYLCDVASTSFADVFVTLGSKHY